MDIIDSLFIDEGLGTLDEDTLDATLTELKMLQPGGLSLMWKLSTNA
jgi:DNA repair exonuclease SbcCD ATPase subunit